MSNKLLNDESKHYIQSLIPKDLPDYKELLAEGREIGENLERRPVEFLEKNGYDNYMEYRIDLAEKGEVNWQILIGQATLKDQIAGIKKIHEFAERTELPIYTVQMIPSPLTALPQDLWEDAAKPTSYIMEDYDDWEAQAAASPMITIFGDHTLASPNALETTVNALKAGSPRVGIFSQFIWDHQGFDDDRQRFNEIIQSLGIVSALRDDYVWVESYLDDGIPGYAMDVTTYIGYALLEHYIVDQLCGARISYSYGGLLSEPDTRLGVSMALDKLLRTDDALAVTYINGCTVSQWDHDIDANYGTSVQEMLFETLVERKYKMGLGINPVSITEALRVATVDELLNITAAGIRAEEMASDWDPYMDFVQLEEVRDGLVEQGQKFFDNTLLVLEEAGVDINNPLELLLVIKNMSPTRFEQLFHPSMEEDGIFSSYYPTVLGRETEQKRDMIVAELGLAETTKYDDLKIILGSADGHSYGLMLADGIYDAAGFTVVNGGVDLDPANILDLADEEGTNLIGVSLHNGQCLDYGKQILRLIEERDNDKEYIVSMGGKLNSILPGETEPQDVDHMLRDMGLVASGDFGYALGEIDKRLNL